MPTFNDGENLGSVRTKINAAITTVDAIDQGLSTTDSPVFASIETTDADSINNITVGLGSGSVATNTALGPQALSANTTGLQNSAVGSSALVSNSAGNYNSAVGHNALRQNMTGHFNSAFGRETMRFNTTGNNNSAFGASSLRFNTTGIQNSALGDTSLGSSTTGSNNTGLGYAAGDSITTGSNNVSIGSMSDVVDPTASNQIAIFAGTTKWLCGTGTPEGAITAGIGSIYTRLDGGAGTTLYVKESGTGNTGWVAK